MANNEDAHAVLGLSSNDLRAPGRMAATLGYSVYADILASTISTLDTPANVGIFAGWGSGKSFLLNKIKENLEERSKPYPTTNGKFFKCIVMLWRLLFYYPPEALKRSNEVRFITVYFNALEYAGSDHLWAGLVTRLVGMVEFGIGCLPSAVFRVNSPYRMPLHCVTSSKPEKCRFRTKKLCGTKFPLYGFYVAIFVVAALAGISLLVYALELHRIILEDHSKNTSTANSTLTSLNVKGKGPIALGSVFISIPLIGFLRGFVPVTIKIVNSQQSKVRRLLARRDFSQQLGVMAKIKDEIRHLSKLVRFMELFEQRRIVVAIFIDDLDRLPRQNIAPLLQAIKILLSDPGSRFVSILAIDPYSVSNALEMGIQSEFPAINISGHKFLKQMIQVPFSIPEMNEKEKIHLFRMIEKQERIESRAIEEFSNPVVAADEVDGSSGPVDSDRHVKEDDSTPILRTQSSNHGDEGTKNDGIEMEELDSSMCCKPLDEFADVVKACECVMAELKNENIFPFIKNNLQEMQRLVGILQVTTRVVFSRLDDVKRFHVTEKTIGEPVGITPTQLAAWVVLVGQWPYRITWIVQQVEDREDAGSPYEISLKLRQVYSDAENNITEVTGWRKLIQLDGDPDSLESFLDTHSNWLNVGFLLKLLPHTISLDRSLKSIVAWTSVERDLKRFVHYISKPLPRMGVSDVIEMIKTVCKGSKKLEEYATKCHEHNISGPVLLHGDLHEIKRHLEMTLGDWTLFGDSLVRLKTAHRFKFPS